MANLIPNELDALIKEYLTDGVLTAKEREVVLKKAVSMGLDRDEIDLYLDAQVQKIEQSADAAARRQKGKACPYCGASIPQLTDKCPHCGQDITADANQDLQEIFDKLEEALVDLKDAQAYKRNKAIIERYARKAKMYYGSNPKVQSLLEEIEIETEKAEKQAKSAQTKQTFANTIKNKWLWVLIEAIVFFGITFNSCSKASEIEKQEMEWELKMESHPDYLKAHSDEESPEYKKIRAEYEKLFHERVGLDERGIIYFFLGFGVIICTILFVKNKKG